MGVQRYRKSVKRNRQVHPSQDRLLDTPADLITNEEAEALVERARAGGQYSVRAFCLALIRIGAFKQGAKGYQPHLILESLRRILTESNAAPQVVPQAYFPKYAGIQEWVVGFIDVYFEQFVRRNGKGPIVDLTMIDPDNFQPVDYWDSHIAQQKLGHNARKCPGQLDLNHLEYMLQYGEGECA